MSSSIDAREAWDNYDQETLLTPRDAFLAGYRTALYATPANSPAKNSGEPVGYVWSDKLEQLHSGKWGSIDLSRQSGDTPLYATPAKEGK